MHPMLSPLPDLKAFVSKRTVREQIAAKLAAMIRSGLLRVGDELPSERDLAGTLEVSRETVRGAIQTLAAVGMLEISQGARTRVARTEGYPFTPPGGDPEKIGRYSADEVFRARKLVELAVIREAAIRIGKADIARLQRLVEAQGAMTDDPVRFQISDVEFHQSIYRAGGNRLLESFLGEVYDYALDFRRKALLMPGAVAASWRDHQRVLKALELRDPEAAAGAMERHLLRVHRTTLLAMKQVP
jgi:DNA-binding FadR family transcriptional regulator